MKNAVKFLILIFVMLQLNPKIDAQTKLWCTLPNSGNTQSGVVYEIGLDGNDLNVIHDFPKFNGERPRGKLLYADNGKFYGISEGGFGTFGSIIYEYDPQTDVFTIIHDFFDPETSHSLSASLGSLIQHSNGKIYGLTQSGGIHYDGQLFEYDIQSNIFSVKVDFESVGKGEIPLGILTEASDGKLYGVTYEGGNHGFGVLYVYDPATNIFAVLKNFDGLNIGSNPHDCPLQASNGKLYGMTRTGGVSDLGVIYEYDIGTNTITKKHDFDGIATGTGPEAKFCQASNGLLYAMTFQGGVNDMGVLFEYDIISGTVTKKLDFHGTNGRLPGGSFIEYSDGLLYGMTANGGISDRGMLFRYDPANGNITKLMDFYDEFGEVLYSTLTVGPDENLFAVTYWGGIYPTGGVLFEYNPVNGIYTKRFDFRYAPGGGTPYSDLMKATDGMIYGTTYTGGDLFAGTIYRIDPDDQTFENVYNFDYFNNGGSPIGGLIQASNGQLYGMAGGGANFDGVIYVFDPVSLSLTVLQHFDELNSGKDPRGNLLQASNGKMYGMTMKGGTNQDGVLFEYDIATSTFTKLFDFLDVTSGKEPQGSLMQATNGKLYGLTSDGGSFGNGVLFEYNPMTYEYIVKVHFDDLNKGGYPVGTLLEFGDNQLYGLTASGGINSMGVIFVYDAESETFSKLFNFNGAATGMVPVSTLMAASNNKIYGTTQLGGMYNNGVAFEYDPLADDYLVIHNFPEYKDRPRYGAFLEVESGPGIGEQSTETLYFSICPNPVMDILTIKTDVVCETVFHIRIFNQLGQIVFNQPGVLSGNSSISLNASKLNEGIYFLQLIDENGQAYSGKFVKAE